MVSMCSQRKMPSFLSNFLGDQIFRKLRVSTDFRAIHSKFYGNYVVSGVDIAARSFWVTEQMAFYDVRVFNPIARRCVHMDTSKAYQLNEKEKKRNYNERILEVEHGSFIRDDIID